MRGVRFLVIAVCLVSCTMESDPTTIRPPTRSASPATEPITKEAEIYAAVLQQLGVEANLPKRFEVIYVVDGQVAAAGRPGGDPFRPPLQAFGQDIVAGIRSQTSDELSPLRFVAEGSEALRNPGRPGLVKNQGVLIALGPIDERRRRVLVPNTLWCGGKCSQWQTYVLSRRDGNWAITGTSGPVVAS